nr:hypothetical protein BDOA9_0206180 [Bradyrhizobium sp. DOA9]
MKVSNMSDALDMLILTLDNDGVPVADICRTPGISQATYFKWKNKDDGLLPAECAG